ncbi:cytochrome P450 [Lentithecium fluviatile CBS 122367]|uniref:Cytochrome P450 n=1 Tax=Lentithecium fluviatile CBS 122367 TaxID=1168545 RepID=A0A6G1JFT1_9PLEO|nr:cytochrome P450 [Lentithecium fluviatile CBS 122367]
MLTDLFYGIFSRASLALNSQNSEPWIWALPGLCIAYTIWRMWSFHLSPWMHSAEVCEVPYWVPFLGHTLSLFINAAGLINRGIKHFRGSYEPFSIRVLGERLYIVTAPDDVAMVYNNKVNFSWDAYMEKLLESFGLSELARKVSWHKPQPGPSEHPRMRSMNPQYKSLVHLIEDIYKMQLLPGDKLDAMLNNVMSRLDTWLQWSNLHGPFVMESSSSARTISTKELCAHLITDSTTRSMFGDLIFEYEPEVITNLAVFNDLSWACVFGVPTIFTPKLNKARKRLAIAVQRYLETPAKERTEEAWSVGSIIEATKMWGMDEESRVSMLLMIWWAAHSNTINACFWVLAHVIYDPSLVAALRKETEPAFKNKDMDISYIMQHCPLLESTYLEVLRLVDGAMSIRRVEVDTFLSGKLLKAGGLVIIPYRELHQNPNVWGDTTQRFVPERFLRKPKLSSHSSYRPFGGGVSYCPGRHLAKAEVCGFLAAFLNRFEIDVPLGANGKAQRFPQLDMTKPATGITACVADMDLFVSIKPSNWAK